MTVAGPLVVLSALLAIVASQTILCRCITQSSTSWNVTEAVVESCVKCAVGCSCGAAPATQSFPSGGSVVRNATLCDLASCCCFDQGSTVRGTFAPDAYELTYTASGLGCAEHQHEVALSGPITPFRTCMIAHGLLR